MHSLVHFVKHGKMQEPTLNCFLIWECRHSDWCFTNKKKAWILPTPYVITLLGAFKEIKKKMKMKWNESTIVSFAALTILEPTSALLWKALNWPSQYIKHYILTAALETGLTSTMFQTWIQFKHNISYRNDFSKMQWTN